MKHTKGSILRVLSCLLFVVALFGFSKNVDAAIVSTSHQKYSYSEYQKDLKQLAQKYPDYCQVNVIGKSADNRNLNEVVIGNPEAKKHLLVIGNLHAREYMTIQLCMRQIEYYLANYNKKLAGSVVADVVDDVAIHYVPSCNPDGTAISQYGFRAIKSAKLRKALKKMGGSTSRWKANARGVDLNRNWDIAFRKGGKKGSQGYHGPKAASEPETQALVKWVNDVQNLEGSKVVGVVSYHSTGSILYGRCAGSATDHVKKQTARMTSLARKLTKYRLMPTESISQANSCSREYFLYKKHLPCITIEVGRGACPLRTKEFSSIWKKNKTMVIQQAMLFR